MILSDQQPDDPIPKDVDSWLCVTTFRWFCLLFAWVMHKLLHM